jgi:general secretion pathway protein N
MRASGKRLIAVGVAALVAGLVANFPARVAYHWFAPDELALSGISGSVWNGAAAQGSAGGLFLSELTWRFRALSVFGLKAGYAVSARLPSGFVESDLAVGAGGRMYLNNVAIGVPLASFGSVLPIAGIEGDISIQFSRLVLAGGVPVEADGIVGISGLVLRALAPSALGDYRAVLQTNDGVISAVVEDVAGVLDVDGNLILQSDGSYSFVGQVAPDANAPAAVVEQLRLLGSPDPQGRREFRFEGSL